MTTNLPPVLQKNVERFKRNANPEAKFEQLIWYAKKLQPFPEEWKTPENKVNGCASQVYINAELKDGLVVFHGDSNAQLVKGLVAFLVDGLTNQPPQTILAIEPDFIAETGLNVSLSPSRSNGFYNIFKLMKTKVAQLL
jgi:cysteine desulfuration protein SufE